MKTYDINKMVGTGLILASAAFLALAPAARADDKSSTKKYAKPQTQPFQWGPMKSATSAKSTSHANKHHYGKKSNYKYPQKHWAYPTIGYGNYYQHYYTLSYRTIHHEHREFQFEEEAQAFARYVKAMGCTVRSYRKKDVYHVYYYLTSWRRINVNDKATALVRKEELLAMDFAVKLAYH